MTPAKRGVARPIFILFLGKIFFCINLVTIDVGDILKWYLCHLCISGISKNIQNNLFRSYFMIINERNHIAKYSIICMFRKCFVNILPFSKFIFVLLQAYLLIRNRERYITSLVSAGYLQMTNPDNPTASNQKYKKVNIR